MPLGWTRLNTRQHPPNPFIVFIKALPGKDNEIAESFLQRVAAICVPIMRTHGLKAVSLEEFPANHEFVGRNFNAGEVIQLVLKSPTTKQWLPLKFVQMVLMHELAHNKQMNHSKAFWTLRDKYAGELQELWKRGFTGEGLWGRGQELSNGMFRDADGRLPKDDELPEHICGGTYARRRVRQRRPQISYRERQERRIKKKFGENGVTLGTEPSPSSSSASSGKMAPKPRVASSKRGRELRAAAMTTRFDAQRKARLEAEATAASSEFNEEISGDEGLESEIFSSDAETDNALPGALLRHSGITFVKVCSNENSKVVAGAEDESQRDEMRDLKRIEDFFPQESGTQSSNTAKDPEIIDLT